MKTRVEPVRLFVSYSHLDRSWFGKLRPLLCFSGVEYVHVWHDEELQAGDRWDDEVREALKRMDVFMCMVSYHLLASSYIRDVEMKEAFKREMRGKTIIVPLLICDMADKDVEHLKKFNPLPAWGRSWRSYEREGDTIDAHKPIRTGLWQAIDKAKARKPTPARQL